MKTIGIIGGMSWESTREYYRLINEGIRDRLGGLNSAEIVLRSVNFSPLSAALEIGDWDAISQVLIDRARQIEAAGADFFLIATNTMHKLAPGVVSAVSIPLLHIGEVTADAVRRRGFESVTLLGTRFTMEEDFYRDRLENVGIRVRTPARTERDWIDELIFGRLCRGVFRDDDKKRLTDIVSRESDEGAEAAVLGCTELPLMIQDGEVALPVMDTTALHAAAAVEKALVETTGGA